LLQECVYHTIAKQWPHLFHSTIADFSHHVTVFFLVVIIETALHQLPDTNRKEALIAEPSLHVCFGLFSF
jgi:hypothetical protein